MNKLIKGLKKTGNLFIIFGEEFGEIKLDISDDTPINFFKKAKKLSDPANRLLKVLREPDKYLDNADLSNFSDQSLRNILGIKDMKQSRKELEVNLKKLKVEGKLLVLGILHKDFIEDLTLDDIGKRYNNITEESETYIKPYIKDDEKNAVKKEDMIKHIFDKQNILFKELLTKGYLVTISVDDKTCNLTEELIHEY